MQQLCEAIVGTTAETITFTEFVNYLRINNGIADELYLKFNWAAGDTEVSATNFDVVLTDYLYLEIIRRAPSFPKFKNMRVICATGGSVGIMAW